jgi:hypothetical protein
MASNTRETWKRRLRRKARAGRKRKNQESRHSTPSAADLFAGMGEPGKPAPKAAIAAARPPARKSA